MSEILAVGMVAMSEGLAVGMVAMSEVLAVGMVAMSEVLAVEWWQCLRFWLSDLESLVYVWSLELVDWSPFACGATCPAGSF